MLYRDIPITQVRHQLTSLPKRLAKGPGAIPVTCRGKPVLAVLPWELYEAITETLEIMADERFMSDLRQGIKEAQKGRGIPLAEIKRELAL